MIFTLLLIRNYCRPQDYDRKKDLHAVQKFDSLRSEGKKNEYPQGNLMGIPNSQQPPSLSSVSVTPSVPNAGFNNAYSSTHEMAAGKFYLFCVVVFCCFFWSIMIMFIKQRGKFNSRELLLKFYFWFTSNCNYI